MAGPAVRKRHECIAKTSHSPLTLSAVTPNKSESNEVTMPALHTDRALPVTDLHSLPFISDDECIVRLAAVVENHDSDHLDELAALIGRLVVPMEL
ncbi:hypothetical protein V1281_001830 [Nitrobacteraceae bacterium AZCC 2161]